MTNNPQGTSPEQPVDPITTVVDKPQEAEEIKGTEVPVKAEVNYETQYNEFRSLSDRRHASTLEQFAILAKKNPELLQDMDGSTEDARKIRDSVVKRVYPQFSTYEQAQDYINGTEDPKVQIDAKVKDEDIRLNAYLDALSEFNEDYLLDSQRTKFKDEFRSYVTTLPYEERLQKTKRTLGLDKTSGASATPVSGTTTPVAAPVKSEREKKEETYNGTYASVKHLIK